MSASTTDHDTARHRPKIDAAAARTFLADVYDLLGILEALPSDRDANLLVRQADRRCFVLKVAHAREDRRVLEAQHAAMKHVAARGLTVPRVVASREGSDITEWTDAGGRRHLARVLTYVPGIPFAKARPRSMPLREEAGRFVGRLTAALGSFEHDALHRPLAWDLARSGETIDRHLGDLDTSDRRLVERVVHLYLDEIEMRAPYLRRGIIHNDVNDYNLLVEVPARRERGIAGLIDFGDCLHSFVAAELAVAAAYAALDAADPLRALSAVVSGFNVHVQLMEDEAAALVPLIAARLAISLCMSAHQSRREPGNAYLTTSRAPVRKLLDDILRLPPRLAHYVFRKDAGYEPCPSGAAVATWCRRLGPRSVLDHTRATVLDFSAESAAWSFADLTTPGRAGARLTEELDARGADLGVGRYAETRLAYRGDHFLEGSQMRTVHLGVDLFQPAGSPVHAPLDGRVHAVADNAGAFDYGPTVILEHRPEAGPAFYTLYGHLSRRSIADRAAGDLVRAGERIGELGAPEENGGWAPHVHVQIVADLLGHEGDFPGAAAPWVADVWQSLSPDAGPLLGFEAVQEPARPTSELIRARRAVVGPALRLSYEKPVHVSRGYGATLFDRDGQPYLDTVNNVAHVGHAHPQVADAVAQKMRVLNTNTRYVYGDLTHYAERLVSLLPEPLQVCYLVNSGSEANDLALRLARAHTRRTDVVVIDHAYHGNLSSLIDISPYKFNGPGGSGRPDHVHVAQMPAPHRQARGPETGRTERGSGPESAASVKAAAARAAGGPAAFFAESAMGCGGQIFYPEGYLSAAFAAIRSAGGVCVADEVQTGFGRMGQAFWAFTLQDVIPDIVTMGKPIGNGFPLGAVVTTREIARSFDQGMEYFNTFGGNAVSCAAGGAVLDVIEEEGLQQNALRVGTHFLRELEAVKARHDVVGDVRGSGLFIGLDLVRDRHAMEPAGETARYVVERMRELGILAGRDGPSANVLKIKPPLVFSTADADRYADTLDIVLGEDVVRGK